MSSSMTPQKAMGPAQTSMPPATPLPSSRLKNQLGFGTGVTVFEMVRSPRVNQFRSPWAVKSVMKNQKKTIFGKRLMVEAQLLRQMDHPNIVGFRKFTETTDGAPCLAMEKCGKSLGDMIEERREDGKGPYPSKHILKMILDISNGLNYLHTEVFLLHGDIKSFNILINDNFVTCKLCDFGVSLPLSRDGKLDNSHRKDFVGTELWAAPEVFSGDFPISDKTDIFSFGLTIWEMLSLIPPHCPIIDESDTNSECSVLEESALYGTRPPIPDDIDEAEYELVLQVFLLATEDNADNRPSAHKIYSYIKQIKT